MGVTDAVDILIVATEFYALETAESLIKPDPFMPSNVRWKQDFDAYKEAFLSAMENSVYDYTVLAVVGEARHARGKCLKYSAELPVGGDRCDAYEWATQYNPENLLTLCEKIYNPFTNPWRSGSFGGQAWHNITLAGQMRKKMMRIPWLDHCIDLSHNGSYYFDKSNTMIYWLGSSIKYRDFLDKKSSTTEPATLFCGVSWRLYDLLERAHTLGLLTTKQFSHAALGAHFNFNYLPDTAQAAKQNIEYWQESIELFLAYKPIQWGGRTVSLELVESKYDYCEECDHEPCVCDTWCGDCGCYGCECDDGEDGYDYDDDDDDGDGDGDYDSGYISVPAPQMKPPLHNGIAAVYAPYEGATYSTKKQPRAMPIIITDSTTLFKYGEMDVDAALAFKASVLKAAFSTGTVNVIYGQEGETTNEQQQAG